MRAWIKGSAKGAKGSLLIHSSRTRAGSSTSTPAQRPFVPTSTPPRSWNSPSARCLPRSTAAWTESRASREARSPTRRSAMAEAVAVEVVMTIAPPFIGQGRARCIGDRTLAVTAAQKPATCHDTVRAAWASCSAQLWGVAHHVKPCVVRVVEGRRQPMLVNVGTEPQPRAMNSKPVRTGGSVSPRGWLRSRSSGRR